ncbi:AgmX/PglI C-terminal domain-containing protein [Geomonas nitrogeniifigens]|uniref:AgmX/PglI C-terminal domain-containing protein n=1 Tax=Geomonas diazotrophica TaxID=2843197 RepID=A0ABX8JEV4_9BACT|nr:AgmX/PglI C-terminal domain-containing protein [Geomonas nitrogeniifigens]
MPSGCTVNTSLLEQELAPLNARIEEVRGTLSDLEMQMQVAEAELDMFSADRACFDALRDACDALERLAALEVKQLFWGVLPEIQDPEPRLSRIKSCVARFDDEIRGSLERKAGLRAQMNRRQEELDLLHEEIHDAHARDERRDEEYLVEREVSPVPGHTLVMPWSDDEVVERRYRRTMCSSMLLALLLAIVVLTVTLPPPVRPVIAEVPERLAMMVRKEYHKPEPPRKAKEEKKEEKKDEKKEETAGKKEEKKQSVAQDKPAPDHPRPAAVEQAAAPKKSQNTGVLAFKESLKDLIDETPTANLGAEARLANPANYAAGHAQASRSLVTMQGGGGPSGGGYGAVSRNVGNGGSGGIGSAAVGRSIGGGGSGRLGRGDAGFAQVKSGIAGPGGAKEGRPLSSGARAARPDEEIQILFDRYKAALYRIYNTELRKDPTLRGKMVLRIAIEPSGAVSACSVDSTNMNAAAFCDQIVDRVRKFNFGPKEGVPKTTILYPIDFLPAR